jgi:hypothetical protein
MELSRLKGDTERLFAIFSALIDRLMAIEARLDALGAVPPRMPAAEASGSENPAATDEAPPPLAQATQDEADAGREDSELPEFDDLPVWMKAALECMATLRTEPP